MILVAPYVRYFPGGGGRRGPSLSPRLSEFRDPGKAAEAGRDA